MMRDATGFDAFYQATSRRVLLHVYTVCADRTEAQDLTQEAYARAWQHWPSVSRHDSPEAWVRTVAWRLGVNRWRSGRRRLAALARLGQPDPAPPPSPDTVMILDGLRRLSPAQRRALVLYYLCGLTIAEVAETTGQAAGTVKAQLSRGRTSMQAVLADSSLSYSNRRQAADARQNSDPHRSEEIRESNDVA